MIGGLLMINACYSNDRQPQHAPANVVKTRIDSVAVKRVNFDTETIVAVDCAQFESSFGEQLIDTSFIITNPDALAEIQTLLASLHPLQGVHVDARGQAKVYRGGKVTEMVCFDDRYMTKGGKCYSLNYRLMSLFGVKLQWP